jgi:hypothetical protein
LFLAEKEIRKIGPSISSVPGAVDDAEDEEEEVDDVQVEVESGEDVLLGVDGVLETI